MPDSQPKAQELVTRRGELQDTYSTKDIPLWPLQVACSRLDEFLFRTPDNESLRQNSERASRALDQAAKYASHYLAQQREEQVQVERTMWKDLKRDIPLHYLLEKKVEELT